MSARAAYLVDACRTPIGRRGGVLAGVRPDELAARVITAILHRTGVDAADVDEVVLGCVNQAGEASRNVARMAWLLAGLPVEVPARTVNRLCGSGLDALREADLAIRAGDADVVVAGGVESLSRAPRVVLPAGLVGDSEVEADSAYGTRFPHPSFPAEWLVSMGETAERVAARYGLSREEQDRFASESHRKALRAAELGWFRNELVPVTSKTAVGGVAVEADETPRPGATPAVLARLRPPFREGGTVTAGSSSPPADAAAALLLCSEATVGALPHRPLARVVASAVAGVDPAEMGLGPVPAVRAALARGGLTANDIDLVELQESFAAQAIACIRDLELDPERVNVSGGAVALGHPFGASGARLATTLAHGMKRTGARFGLAATCVGLGQGVAVVLERCD